MTERRFDYNLVADTLTELGWEDYGGHFRKVIDGKDAYISITGILITVEFVEDNPDRAKETVIDAVNRIVEDLRNG